uniref:Putative delta 6-fatty acid desaturase/delta-8 sphingolipid desaturase n=1 Tax=Lutzomyia longipalpis TaxID=7200 RepID=A0A1B0CJ83_LUTLO
MQKKGTSISRKYPSLRDIPTRTQYSWLEGRRLDDGAEGLWRVHDGIYDLTDFVEKHPEDGFFRTFKRRVREKLKTIDTVTPARLSNLYTDVLFIMTYVMAVAALVTKNYIVGFLAALTLTWCVICAHNYFHRRNNWRMYIFNLSFMSFNITSVINTWLYIVFAGSFIFSLIGFNASHHHSGVVHEGDAIREWRISHALSHHLYTNSLHDLEISLGEPFLCWIPDPKIKNWFQRYASWIYGPFIYCLIYISEFIKKQNSDWAIYQMDTAMDREDINRSHFFTLTFFGQHILHHIFPTLDHGVLAQLQPEFVQTLKEFEYDFRECSWFEHIIEQHKQLARIEPRTAYKGQSHLGLDDLIPFSVPLVMYLATGESITSVINTWLYIVFAGSFIFSLIGFNASHHHSGVVHEGDAIRQNSDWAIYQMDTAMDREDINRSHFFTLTFFGQHILHHIFPTLDHGVLAQLQPEFVQTLKEFEYDFRECSWFEHIIEQHKQLARIEPRTAYKGQVKKTK